MTNAWSAWIAAETAAIESRGRWRTLRDLDGSSVRGVHEGRPIVSFAGNDYLGLSQHPDVVKGAQLALERWGAGSGAARLICGSRPVHAELEAEIGTWKGTGSALLFPSGYSANVGVLSALGAPGTTIFSDALNHASIIDGCRLARADVKIYPHRNLDALDALLGETPGLRLIVSDSVFSMEGDIADTYRLIELAEKHDALLVLDEAHAVLGPEIAGDGSRLVRVGTLSKFLGAAGGYVAASEATIDLLRNSARSFIFTTAGSPMDAGAALAAIKVFRSPGGTALRKRLRRLIDKVAPGHPSPIVPLRVGDEDATMATAARLLERGYWVGAIRPPSVPAGTSRLRVTLSAAHTDEEVEGLLDALTEEEVSPA